MGNNGGGGRGRERENGSVGWPMLERGNPLSEVAHDETS